MVSGRTKIGKEKNFVKREKIVNMQHKNYNMQNKISKN